MGKSCEQQRGKLDRKVVKSKGAKQRPIYKEPKNKKQLRAGKQKWKKKNHEMSTRHFRHLKILLESSHLIQ